MNDDTIMQITIRRSKDASVASIDVNTQAINPYCEASPKTLGEALVCLLALHSTAVEITSKLLSKYGADVSQFGAKK